MAESQQRSRTSWEGKDSAPIKTMEPWRPRGWWLRTRGPGIAKGCVTSLKVQGMIPPAGVLSQSGWIECVLFPRAAVGSTTTGGLKQQTCTGVHSSGGRQSDISVSTGIHAPRGGSREERVPCLSSSIWWYQVFLRLQKDHSHSPSAHGVLPVVSVFSWPSAWKDVSHIGLGAHPNDLILTRCLCKKTLSPNKVTFRVLGARISAYLFCGT